MIMKLFSTFVILGLIMAIMIPSCLSSRVQVIHELRQDKQEAKDWLKECEDEVLRSETDPGSVKFYMERCGVAQAECCHYNTKLIIINGDTLPCEDLSPAKRKRHCGEL